MKSNIYFFYGEDTYSISKKIKFWTDQFEQKHGGDTNIETIEGKELDPKKFGTNLQAMPFLAEKRLVIVRDFLSNAKTDDQKIVAEILDKEIPDFCVLVFSETSIPDKRTSLFKLLNKIAKVEEFQSLPPPQLINWVMDETAKREGQIGRIEADFLAQRVGPNLWQLSNEIDKLISATTKSSPITKRLIEDLVTPSLSSSIFRLTDSIATKNRKGSLQVFKTLVDSGEDLMMIFYMLVRHFRILIQAHFLVNEGNDPTSIARKLKQHPYVATTASNQSKNFTREQLKKIYEQLLEIDKSFKTGRIKITADDNRELLLEIERFIINTCNF
ncbi:MAG: DNA polymerase III subunit delta [Candidatus Gracilibacteria bacterium]